MDVVGAGILGMASAIELLEAGEDVDLYDPDGIMQGMTARSAGIVSSFCWNDLDTKLVQKTRGRIGEIISLTAGAVPHARGAWRSHDSLLIGKDGATLRAYQDRCHRHTEEAELLSFREAAQRYPGLEFAPGEEVLIAQEDGYVELGDLADALREYFEMLGGKFIQKSWRPTGNTTVIAAGRLTRSIFNSANIDLPLLCYQTHASSWTFKAEIPIIHDLTNHFYGRPDGEGRILLGNGTVLEPTDPEEDHDTPLGEFVPSISEKASRRIGNIGEATLARAWRGLCVGTPDRRPLVGKIPWLDETFVISGGNGYGVMRSFGLADMLADTVQGKTSEFSPDRFGEGPHAKFPLREGYGDTSD